MAAPETAPETTPFSPESLFGETLLQKVGVAKNTADLLKGKELIALYFSASWCPPCKVFSPVLASFYERCSKNAKLEIIYVSSDKTVDAFEGYYNTMPWLAIPAEQGSAATKSKLAETFAITGIPALIVIDAKTGEFITSSAREHVSKANRNAAKCKEVIQQWKTMERKPLSAAGGGGQGGALMKIFMYVARNPMFLVGLLYMYKEVMKRIKAQSSGETGEL
jgi:nucleoredoxin